VKYKRGYFGPLLFVDIQHRYRVAGKLRISELQTLVYTGKGQDIRTENKREAQLPKYEQIQREIGP